VKKPLYRVVFDCAPRSYRLEPATARLLELRTRFPSVCPRNGTPPPPDTPPPPPPYTSSPHTSPPPGGLPLSAAPPCYLLDLQDALAPVFYFQSPSVGRTLVGEARFSASFSSRLAPRWPVEPGATCLYPSWLYSVFSGRRNTSHRPRTVGLLTPFSRAGSFPRLLRFHSHRRGVDSCPLFPFRLQYDACVGSDGPRTQGLAPTGNPAPDCARDPPASPPRRLSPYLFSRAGSFWSLLELIAPLHHRQVVDFQLRELIVQFTFPFLFFSIPAFPQTCTGLRGESFLTRRVGGLDPSPNAIFSWPV